MRCLNCEKVVTPTVYLVDFFSFKVIMPDWMCLSCQKSFTKIEIANACLGCAKGDIQKYCQDCLLWREKYPALKFSHQALYHYDENMKAWFQRYKFDGHVSLAECFANDIKAWFKDTEEAVVIPIPLSKTKQAERGFNQVGVLLKASGIQWLSVLKKNHQGLNQSQLTRNDRLEMAQPFQLDDHGAKQIKGKRVIIVDDIYTTGRTMYWAALLINSCEPIAIKGFSLAR